MRLLMTIPDYWPYVRRGSERVVHDLSACLAETGHDVTVVTRAPSGRGHTVRRDAVRIVYCRTWGRAGRLLKHDHALEAFGVTAFGAGLRFRGDIAHAFHFPDAYGLASASRATRVPVVLSIHGTPGREWWERYHRRTHDALVRALPRLATVTVLSEDSARRMRRDYDVDPLVVAPGIVTADFAAPLRPPQHPTIVCAAAIDDPRKRLDVLLGAFEIVARDDDSVRLLLVGPGDPSAVDDRAASMAPAIARRVSHRDVPTSDLPSILSECTVAALTSHEEAFGLVLLEAMAAGLPVVGTNDGGIPEFVAPGTGTLFERESIADCAAALRASLRLAEDPGTERRCRAHAATYDWSRRVQAYLDIYCGLAA